MEGYRRFRSNVGWTDRHGLDRKRSMKSMSGPTCPTCPTFLPRVRARSGSAKGKKIAPSRSRRTKQATAEIPPGPNEVGQVGQVGLAE